MVTAIIVPSSTEFSGAGTAGSAEPTIENFAASNTRSDFGGIIQAVVRLEAESASLEDHVTDTRLPSRNTLSFHDLPPLAPLSTGTTVESVAPIVEELAMPLDAPQVEGETTVDRPLDLSTDPGDVTALFAVISTASLRTLDDSTGSSHTEPGGRIPGRADEPNPTIPSTADPIRRQPLVMKGEENGRPGRQLPTDSPLALPADPIAEFLLADPQPDHKSSAPSGQPGSLSLIGGPTAPLRHLGNTTAEMTELDSFHGTVHAGLGAPAEGEPMSGASLFNHETYEQTSGDTLQFIQDPSLHEHPTGRDGQTFLGHLTSMRSSDTSVASENAGSSTRQPVSQDVRQPDTGPFLPVRSVQVDLSSTELGAVKVRVALSDQMVHAHIKTDQAQLGQLLFTHRDQLESSIGAVGFDLGELRVSVGQQEQQHVFEENSTPGAPDHHPPRHHATTKPGDSKAAPEATAMWREEHRLLSIVA